MTQSGYSFRMAVESALRSRAKVLGLNPQRLQRELVCHRLLARLLVVAPDRWALKGGLALDFRLGTRGRTTRDMDLAWLESPEQTAADLLTAGAIDLEDHFSFRLERVSSRGEADDNAIRYRVSAEFAGRRYLETAVDIGFSEATLGAPELVSPPAHLDLPGIKSAPVPVISIEQHIAEKLHAYTRVYASGPSSRVKDLVDLALIARYMNPDSSHLADALEYVFTHRGAHALPSAIPPPPESWGQPYQLMAMEVGLTPDLWEAFGSAEALLNPILAGTTPRLGVWLSGERRWSGDAHKS